MKAKEKAKELINKFYQPLGYIKHNENSNSLWNHGKKLALICVDEILKSGGNILLNNKEDIITINPVEEYYWNEIMIEIRKL